jgi:hypothetical protein
LQYNVKTQAFDFLLHPLGPVTVEICLPLVLAWSTSGTSSENSKLRPQAMAQTIVIFATDPIALNTALSSGAAGIERVMHAKGLRHRVDGVLGVSAMTTHAETHRFHPETRCT